MELITEIFNQNIFDQLETKLPKVRHMSSQIILPLLSEPCFKNDESNVCDPHMRCILTLCMHHFLNVATLVLCYNFYFAQPHRHEPPVLAGEVIILEEGPDVMTVCKPASVPVRVIENAKCIVNYPNLSSD